MASLDKFLRMTSTTKGARVFMELSLDNTYVTGVLASLRAAAASVALVAVGGSG